MDYNENLRLAGIEREALAIADDVSCILGFAQSYYNQKCLTEKRLNDIYSMMNSDPFSRLHNTRYAGNELNDLMRRLRTELKELRCYDANQICEYWEKHPEYMNRIANIACEEYKGIKLRLNSRLSSF